LVLVPWTTGIDSELTLLLLSYVPYRERPATGGGMSDPSGIVNWRRLNDCVTTSGQPSEVQLAAIKELGVTHIVNLGLHTHEKALADEGDTVAELGMTYIHIPVDFDMPTEADFDRFCAVMKDMKDDKVHVHCIVNARVSAFFYRYQRDILGMDEANARAAMETVWRPGGAWATFIGDEAGAALPHQFARRDY
jgi:protein tyrosine phosphatase (PTP) superfamily phosphohydrolase (DUF442 family)